MQGFLVRSRAKFINDSKNPTNFFCNLEKNNYTSNIAPKLETNNGEIVTDQHEILNETKIFYEDLYVSKDSQLINIDLFEIFRSFDTKNR